MGTPKFEELRDKRLAVAVSKIELLGNLGRSPYQATEIDRLGIAMTLNDAVGDLIDRLKINKPAAVPEPPKPRPAAIPQGTAAGGSDFEHEVRWALDAIKRGEPKLAAERLKRILQSEELS